MSPSRKRALPGAFVETDPDLVERLPPSRKPFGENLGDVRDLLFFPRVRAPLVGFLEGVEQSVAMPFGRVIALMTGIAGLLGLHRSRRRR